MTDSIILGSGKIFMTVYDGAAIPADAVIEEAKNEIGAIQGGATIEYSNEFYEAKDDLGRYTVKMMTVENASMKCNFITWNGETILYLCQTAEKTEAADKVTIKIGGIGRFADKRYVIRFLHENKAKGNVRVTIVGSNQGGMTLTFAKDKETLLPAEFKAVPNDEEGTLIILELPKKATTPSP